MVRRFYKKMHDVLVLYCMLICFFLFQGKDLRLLLVGDALKLVDAQTKATILVQPISKMRVWGAGRNEQT